MINVTESIINQAYITRIGTETINRNSVDGQCFERSSMAHSQ